MRPLLTALAAAVAAATVSLACGQDEEVTPATEPSAAATASPTAVPTGAWTAPSGTPVPKPGWKAVRFLNVTASAPEGVLVAPLAGYTFSATNYYNRPVVTIEPQGRDDVRIVIDAETGAIVEQVGSDLELAGLHPVLDTVRVSHFDSKAAPWPYADTAPPDQLFAWGEIVFPVPDPLTGIAVGTEIGDGGPPGQCNSAILVGNGRSKMAVSACTGEPFLDSTDIQPEDKDAFRRFLEEIEVKP